MPFLIESILDVSLALLTSTAPRTCNRFCLKAEAFFLHVRKNPRPNVVFLNRFCQSTRKRNDDWNHSRPQSPSFLGQVVLKRGAPLVRYKLSRVALWTRMDWNSNIFKGSMRIYWYQNCDVIDKKICIHPSKASKRCFQKPPSWGPFFKDAFWVIVFTGYIRPNRTKNFRFQTKMTACG